MKDSSKCAFPGCNNNRCSVQRRRSLSPVVAAGGDKSKRSKWCMYHRKGNGKAARIAYTAEQAK